MMTALWLAAILVPTILGVAVLIRGPVRALGLFVAPLAALPALSLALIAGVGSGLSLSWVLLGMRLGLDATGLVLLLITSLVWLATGIYLRGYLASDSRRHVFWCFFLLSMSGNLWVILARDVVTFYCAFSLMTFASYGLVIYRRTGDAQRAGRIYLTMALVGEMCILAGMLLTVWRAASIDLEIAASAAAVSPQRGLIIVLFLIGFGVKVAALPLHVWSPLAYTAAPAPAAAVLSACMSKAGLLGWIRFLPLGTDSLHNWGGFVMAMGLLAAFFGVAGGLIQRNPKTLLAYSSISQLGLITVAVGAGFLGSEAWDLALVAIAVYVTHHALAKSALFLGVGLSDAARGRLWPHRFVLTGMAIASLALAGAPLTSGAFAKTALKEAAHEAHSAWVDLLLPLTSVGTTILMAHFILLMRAELAGDTTTRDAHLWKWLPWAGLVAAIGSVSWILPWYVELDGADPTAVTMTKVWSGVWPVLAGLVLFGGAGYLLRHRGIPSGLRVPPGDIIVVVEAALRRLPRFPDLDREGYSPRRVVTGAYRRDDLLEAAEAKIARLGIAGVIMLSLFFVFLLLLA